MNPRITRRLALGLVGLAMLSAPAVAQGAPANVVIVHGINGLDLGQAGPELPVDISVDGGCLLNGVEFGDFTQPVQLAAGSYAVRISLANAGNPCSNNAVIEGTFTFAEGENATVIAHLDESGTPVATKFVNDLSPSAAGARVLVHHTAVAPAVDVGIRRVSAGRSAKLLFFGVPNGAQGSGDVPAGNYRIAAAVAGTDGIVLGPLNLPVAEDVAYLVYVVGSASNGTLSAIVVTADI